MPDKDQPTNLDMLEIGVTTRIHHKEGKKAPVATWPRVQLGANWNSNVWSQFMNVYECL